LSTFKRQLKSSYLFQSAFAVYKLTCSQRVACSTYQTQLVIVYVMHACTCVYVYVYV